MKRNIKRMLAFLLAVAMVATSAMYSNRTFLKAMGDAEAEADTNSDSQSGSDITDGGIGNADTVNPDADTSGTEGSGTEDNPTVIGLDKQVQGEVAPETEEPSTDAEAGTENTISATSSVGTVVTGVGSEDIIQEKTQVSIKPVNNQKVENVITNELKNDNTIVQEVEASYTIKYFKEIFNSGKFEECEKIYTMGQAGSTVYAPDKSYEGYVFDNENKDNKISGVVAPDGTLVLSRYYKIRTDISYTVKYETMEGKTLKEEKSVSGQKFGDTITERAADITGYTVEDQEESLKLKAEDNVITFVYKPSATRYKVQYYLQASDGSYPEEAYEEVSKDALVDMEVSSAEEIKVFAGYTYDEENTQNVKSGTVTSDGSFTLKLYYKANDAKIIFDTRGGTAVDDLDGKTGFTIKSIELPKTNRMGYTFVGWFENEDLSGKAIELLPSVFPEGTTTYYAKWKVNSATLTYVAEKGGTVDPEKEVVDVTAEMVSGSTAKPNRGYTFEGWYMEDERFEDQKLTQSDIDRVAKEKEIYKDTTFTAGFKPITYPINYHNLEGAANAESNPNGYTVEEDITLKDPTKEGYEFKGWYTDAKLTEPAVSPAIPNGSIGEKDFYAKWNEVITYEITYDLAGGTNAPENPSEYTIESEDITLKAPTRDGYEFNGWYRNEGRTDKVDGVAIQKGSTGPQKLYASWTAIEYLITYDLDGGILASGMTNPESYTTETETFTLNNPSREGYTFLGWTGTEIDEPTVAVTVEKGSKGERSYKANWQADDVSISFEVNGGSSVDTMQGKTDQSIENQNMPETTKENYRFAGWYGNSELAGQQVTRLPESYPSEDITYYAKWERDTSGFKIEGYEVVYDGASHSITTTGSLVDEERWQYSTDNSNWSDSAQSLTNTDVIHAEGYARVVDDQGEVVWAAQSAKTVISKRDLTVTAQTESFPYTGKEHSVSYDIGEKELVNGQNTEVELSGAKQTEAGTYPVTVESVKISAAGKDVTSNYDITTVPGRITIEANTEDLKFAQVPTGYVAPYDGDSHDAVTNVSVTGVNGAPIPSEDLTVEYSTDGGNTYQKEVPQVTAVSDSKEVWVKVTAKNYEEPVVAAAHATVTRRPVTVKAEEIEIPYDGKPHTIGYYIIESDSSLGIVKNQKESVTLSGETQTETGRHQVDVVDVDIRAGDTIVKDNYEVTKLPGYLNITANTVDLKFAQDPKGYSGIYDGTSYDAVTDIKVTGVAGRELPVADLTIEYSIDGGVTYSSAVPKVTEVSDSTEVTIKAAAKNYAGTIEKTVQAIVAARPVTVKADEGRFRYDGTLQRVGYKITEGSLAARQTEEVTLADAERTEVGENTVNVDTVKILAGNQDVSQNYDISKLSGKIEVYANDSDLHFAQNSPTGYRDIYDGKSHDAVTGVNVTGLGGQKISKDKMQIEYSIDDGATFGPMPQLTDVSDSRKIIIRVTVPNYKPIDAEVYDEVLPKEVTVIPEDNSKVYGEDEPELLAEVKGLIDSDKIDYTVWRTQGDKVGSYEIQVSGAALQGNYQLIAGTPATFTVYGKVYYLSNGGTGIPPMDGIKYKLSGNASVLENSLTREQAVFIGWSEEAHNLVTRQDEEMALTLIKPGSGIQMGEESITLYAIWAVDKSGPDGKPDEKPDHKQFTLVYDGNGNTAGSVPVDNNKYNADSDIQLQQGMLTKENAVFLGWSYTQQQQITSQTEKNEVDFVDQAFRINTDTTVYAVWAQDSNGPEGGSDGTPDYKQYILVYNGNGNTAGTAPVDTNLYNTDDAITLKGQEVLARDNAVFMGWSIEANEMITVQAEEDGVSFARDGLNIARNTELYAVWAEDKNGNGIPDYKEAHYSVAFAAGSNGNLTDGTVFENILTGTDFYDSVTVPTPIPEDGYYFAGWTPVLPEEGASVTGDVTYTAIFAPNDYGLSITYAVHCGESIENLPDSYNTQVEMNQGYMVEAPDYEGYVKVVTGALTGTMTTEGAVVTIVYHRDENGNGVPDCEEEHYNINFVAGQNGSLEGSSGFSDILAGLDFYDNVAIPTPVSNEGYHFTGWTPELPGDEAVSANAVYTANFEQNRHHVIIDYVTPGGEDEIPDVNDEYGYGDSYEYIIPQIPGYTPSVEVIKGNLGDEDVNVVVNYTPNSYTVTINYVDEAKNVMSPVYNGTFIYKETFTITSPIITGYTMDYASISSGEKGMPAYNQTFTVTYTEVPVIPTMPDTPSTTLTTPGSPVTPAASAISTAITPAAVTSAIPTTIIPPTTTAPEDAEITQNGDGDYDLTPIADTKAISADKDLHDNDYGLLPILLMPLALIALAFYTRSRKKRTRSN